MRLLLFILSLCLTSVTIALPINQQPRPSGLTLPALDTPSPQTPDLLSFITSAPDYIVKAFGAPGTACSISRVLPIFCGDRNLDERMSSTEEMAAPAAAETATCGSGFEGWVCAVMAHTSLLAFIFLIFAPLLALGIYKWKKVRHLFSLVYKIESAAADLASQSQKQKKKFPLPLTEPQANGYSQAEEIQSKWMPMSPL